VIAVNSSKDIQELHFAGHPSAQKLKSLRELESIVRQARTEGKTIVLTNGCFDLFHAGHHHLLQAASTEGDVLIVAVNSDDSVRRLKGPQRPLIPLERRLLIIMGLEVVDYVTAFEEDTATALIEAIRPDVLVKGEEYRTGWLAERQAVHACGGRVVFVDRIPGLSTTSLLQERAASRSSE